MTYIWERGIMMSRTAESKSRNTPSIMERHSVSISLRSCASCRMSSSSVRESGSEEMKEASLSRKVLTGLLVF